jgi:hypothetical protein
MNTVALSQSYETVFYSLTERLPTVMPDYSIVTK